MVKNVVIPLLVIFYLRGLTALVNIQNSRTKGSNQRAEKIELIVIRWNRRHHATSSGTEQTTTAKHIIPWLDKRNLNIRTAANKNCTVKNNKSKQGAEISKRWFSDARNSCSTPSIYLHNSNLCFLLQIRSRTIPVKSRQTATHNLHITTCQRNNRDP